MVTVIIPKIHCLTSHCWNHATAKKKTKAGEKVDNQGFYSDESWMIIIINYPWELTMVVISVFF